MLPDPAPTSHSRAPGVGDSAARVTARTSRLVSCPSETYAESGNPGATDTGWATPALHAEVLAREPFGRWGEPDDAARLIAWLVSDEGRWRTGQVLNSEGGFRR